MGSASESKRKDSYIKVDAENPDTPSWAYTTPFPRKSIAGYMGPDLTTYLKSHFMNSVARGYPAAKFISNVWHFDIVNLRLDSGQKSFILNEEYAKAFLSGAWCKSVVDNEVLYEGKAAITLENLWHDLTAQFPPRSGHTPMSFLTLQGCDVRSTNANYIPDFGFTPPLSTHQGQSWERLVSCGDLKKHHVGKMDDDVQERLQIHAHQIKGAYGISKRKKDSIETDEEVSCTTSEVANRNKTRRTGYDNEPMPIGQATTPPSVCHVGKELAGHELQIADYLTQMLSHGVRTYATAFFLHECNMTLWYADRMGLVVSEPFDIFAQSPLFLLVVAAHHYADPYDFGLHPLIALPVGSPHLVNYKNTTLRLPMVVSADLPPIDTSLPDAHAFDEGITTTQSVEFQMDLDGRHITTAYEALGRGTAVIPILAGVGTTLCLDGARLVAKITSPREALPAEDRLIRILRRKLNEDDHARQYLKHVVDLKCSFSCKMDDKQMKLPRCLMGPVADDHRRGFRILIMSEYLPLEHINSPAELKQIFIDTITGHHWVWKTSHILHRDISYGNIMFYREFDGTNEQVVGVLTDWDMAAKQEYEDQGTQETDFEFMRLMERQAQMADDDGNCEERLQQNESSKRNEEVRGRQKFGLRVRVGTAPFMACDLLQPDSVPRRHLYRHDLESFFWVLTWFCVVFNPIEHTIDTIPAWDSSNWLNVGKAKVGFLTITKEYTGLIARVHADYLPIDKMCIYDFRYCLEEAWTASREERNTKDKYLQALAQPRENNPRYAEFVARASERLTQARETLRDLITYDYFMAVFKIPV
ncbi:hypothetical protein EUX98_g6756 [Antrodiella citrinella]|uniref:Fungal-type protein kinase domain-containing protein n=1 Tax=Antrodiella citrinella TaxID=2447956 RepID=A0A4S4MP00_9APHY|nr:hypothetical protein EUX98_g6756 [Antrodiella citrinella]